MNIQAKRDYLNTLISDTNGKYFTVENIKKNGEARRYSQARIKVSEGVTGAGSSTSHCENLRTIWEKRKATDDKDELKYRALNLDSVTYFKAKGVEINFDETIARSSL